MQQAALHIIQDGNDFRYHILYIEERGAFLLIRHNLHFGRNVKVMKSMIARSSFQQAKPFFETFWDAVKHRYLLMYLLKELSYQFGYRFG